MQEQILSNNNAKLIGTINSEFVFSHEVYGEGFYSFDLKVPRLSEFSDTLSVIISERLIDTSLLKQSMLVQIIGQIRSYNNTSNTTKKNKLLLTIFTKDIEIIQITNSKMTNDIFLNGFVCKPPVFRTTPFGREISDLLVAVNRSYNKSDYIPCIAWGRNARFAGQLKVGDNIKIWGRMQSRTYQKKYEDETIEEKIAYEVSISKIENNTLD